MVSSEQIKQRQQQTLEKDLFNKIKTICIELGSECPDKSPIVSGKTRHVFFLPTGSRKLEYCFPSLGNRGASTVCVSGEIDGRPDFLQHSYPQEKPFIDGICAYRHEDLWEDKLKELYGKAQDRQEERKRQRERFELREREQLALNLGLSD